MVVKWNVKIEQVCFDSIMIGDWYLCTLGTWKHRSFRAIASEHAPVQLLSSTTGRSIRLAPRECSFLVAALICLTNQMSDICGDSGTGTSSPSTEGERHASASSPKSTSWLALRSSSTKSCQPGIATGQPRELLAIAVGQSSMGNKHFGENQATPCFIGWIHWIHLRFHQ